MVIYACVIYLNWTLLFNRVFSLSRKAYKECYMLLSVNVAYFSLTTHYARDMSEILYLQLSEWKSTAGS